MDEFVSTFTNRLDGKGRVSIPAPFRTVLLRDGLETLYCCPSVDRETVDGGGTLFRETLRSRLAAFPPFSEEHEFLSTALLGGLEILKVDPEGRVILPESLRHHAGMRDAVVFVGQGFKFQLWEPDRFAAYRDEAKGLVRDLRKRLGSSHPASGATPGEPA